MNNVYREWFRHTRNNTIQVDRPDLLACVVEFYYSKSYMCIYTQRKRENVYSNAYMSIHQHGKYIYMYPYE